MRRQQDVLAQALPNNAVGCNGSAAQPWRGNDAGVILGCAMDVVAGMQA